MKKILTFCVFLIMLFSLSACSSTEKHYFNQKFEYHNLEIIVTAIDEEIQDNGNYLTTISFSATNIGKHEYDFYLSDVFVKNVATDSKYNCKTSFLDSFIEECKFVNDILIKNFKKTENFVSFINSIIIYM